ncbi:MAG: DUF4893 domain-containing protein [Rhizobiaceae bacterium]
MRKILVFFLALSAAAPAMADGVLDKILSQFDKDRLANFDKTRSEALSEGLRGDAADVDILTKALDGKQMPISKEFDMTGNWKCRVIKVGGTLPLTPYGWFKCRVTDDGSGWFLEKTTGSQRLSGRFYTQSGTKLVFVGAGHVNDDPPRKYGQDPQQDQVAIATRLAENKIVLEFPAPQYESKLDVLVMERGK